MKTRKLGNSDMEITVLGLGTWAIGGPWTYGWGKQDDDASVGAILRALEKGINWIDTAAAYGLGHSEEIVAKALALWKGQRPYVFTKCGTLSDAQGRVYRRLTAESVRAEAEASLRRLKVDAIDLYQCHWPVAGNLAETVEGWAEMVRLQKEGKVRWIGVSNFSDEEINAVSRIARSRACNRRIRFCAARSKKRCCRAAAVAGLASSRIRRWLPGSFPGA
jgi:aryl-alcohol dehydrogenase-like predicted oxidoreductase